MSKQQKDVVQEIKEDGLFEDNQELIDESQEELNPLEDMNLTYNLLYNENHGTKGKAYCTMCGEEFEWEDYQANHYYSEYMGYGSRYDPSVFEVQLCCRCFDDVIDMIIPLFKTNPIKECEFKDGAIRLKEDNENK